jgi:Type II CAAX prenyl endopeptidase Rce1-like
VGLARLLAAAAAAPRLLPLGQWPALLISGAIWGFWHTPLILTGFDYPQHHILGVVLMTLLGMIFGAILGWSRLATGSMWPAVFAHAAIDENQVAGGIYVLLRANASFDTALAGLTGVTGWILPLLFIAFLAATRRLPGGYPCALRPTSPSPRALRRRLLALMHLWSADAPFIASTSHVHSWVGPPAGCP